MVAPSVVEAVMAAIDEQEDAKSPPPDEVVVSLRTDGEAVVVQFCLTVAQTERLDEALCIPMTAMGLEQGDTIPPQLLAMGIAFALMPDCDAGTGGVKDG